MTTKYKTFNKDELNNIKESVKVINGCMDCNVYGDMYFQDLEASYFNFKYSDPSEPYLRGEFDESWKKIEDILDGLANGKYKLEEV